MKKKFDIKGVKRKDISLLCNGAKSTTTKHINLTEGKKGKLERDNPVTGINWRSQGS